MTIGRPGTDEYGSFYAGYVGLVPETDILEALEAQAALVRTWANAVPPEKESYRYAEGKWSPRQVLGHVTDGERVFGYRAFVIGRGEEAPLPGYDEHEYMLRSHFDHRTLDDLAGEFAAIRAVNLLALRTFDERDWRHVGNANGTPVSTRALAWIMVGHVRHHLGVLTTRYGLAAPPRGADGRID